MWVDYAKKQSGKTERAVKWLKEEEGCRIILVFNDAEKRRICNLHPEINKNRVMNFFEFMLNKNVRPPYVEYWVDNLDIILQEMLGGKVSGISLTMEE